MEASRRLLAGASLAWRVPDLHPALNPVREPTEAENGPRIRCDVCFRLLQDRLMARP
jgi:hypothetical protein